MTDQGINKQGLWTDEQVLNVIQMLLDIHDSQKKGHYEADLTISLSIPKHKHPIVWPPHP